MRKRKREREEKNEMKNLSHFLSLTVNDGENLVKKKYFETIEIDWIQKNEKKICPNFLSRTSISLSLSLTH